MQFCCAALIFNQLGLSGPAVQRQFWDRVQWFVHVIIPPPPPDHWSVPSRWDRSQRISLQLHSASGRASPFICHPQLGHEQMFEVKYWLEGYALKTFPLSSRPHSSRLSNVAFNALFFLLAWLQSNGCMIKVCVCTWVFFDTSQDRWESWPTDVWN